MENLHIPLKIRGELNLTLYSDQHLDSDACALDRLRAHMERRAALPNAVFGLIGDAGNWIIPHAGDRRWTDGVITELPRQTLKERRAATVNAILDYHVKYLEGFPWAFIGMGNHEYTMWQRGGIDVTELIIDRLSSRRRKPILYGGYSGIATFDLGKDDPFVLLYHHGGTASQVIPPPKVEAWAACYEGWHVCAYGHNHACGVTPRVRLQNDNGHITHRNVYFVNTGTYQRGARQDGEPDYAERMMLKPAYLGAPLLTITPGRPPQIRITVGDC